MNNKIQMIKVNSSNVHSIGYDYDNHNVTIQFNNSSVYTYFNVPETEFIALKNASSVGKYLDQYYKKDNCYKFIKVR